MKQLSFVVNWYFKLLPLAPLICMIDYYTVHQGFRKLYGTSIMAVGIAILLVKGLKKSKIHYHIFLGFLVYLYYIIWDVINQLDTYQRKGFVYDFITNPYLQLVFLLFVIDNLIIFKKDVVLIVKILKGVMLAAGVVSIIQLISDPFFLTPSSISEFSVGAGLQENVFEVRRVSLFGFTGRMDVSLSMIPVLAIIVSFGLKEYNRIEYLYLIIGGIIAFATNSRYVQVAYVFCWFPVIFSGRFSETIKRMLLIPAFALLAYLVIQIVGFDLHGYIEERILSDSASTRVLAYEMLVRFFPDNPLFGTGFNMTDELEIAIGGRSSQIHVGYFAHLFSYGLVGSILAFGFWFSIQYRLYKHALKTHFWGSFIGFLTFTWANVTLVYYIIFTFGMALAFLFDKYYISEYEKQLKGKQDDAEGN
ncbi:O-antigen ligase family protein [Carboxylicivirga mesophila]|uniref:O-antigen ligase family protein n=1 Tax=Carboxylicivirga mesophila TaxID=1166478 RepID=A0ABS5K9F7_9BACT|nr:O-antigen ligase family protein [Carboxylicivirga mesophila]MBS2211492.1 O-antigen ligase family protein [Carboxylicivirga mesophila]